MSMANKNQAISTGVAVSPACESRFSPRRHPQRPPITINPEKLGGTPTIAGTRLPVTALIDHLLLGHDIDEFVDEFDGADRGDAQAVLLKIKEALEEGWLAETVNY